MKPNCWMIGNLKMIPNLWCFGYCNFWSIHYVLYLEMLFDNLHAFYVWNIATLARTVYCSHDRRLNSTLKVVTGSLKRRVESSFTQSCKEALLFWFSWKKTSRRFYWKAEFAKDSDIPLMWCNFFSWRFPQGSRYVFFWPSRFGVGQKICWEHLLWNWWLVVEISHFKAPWIF